jgi:hypothetical protein
MIACNIPAPAHGALDRPQVGCFIDLYPPVLFILSFAPLDVFKRRIASNIDFVPLIIKIRAFSDWRKVANSKQLPSKTGKTIIGSDLFDKANFTTIGITSVAVLW